MESKSFLRGMGSVVNFYPNPEKKDEDSYLARLRAGFYADHSLSEDVSPTSAAKDLSGTASVAAKSLFFLVRIHRRIVRFIVH
jgi:hypothetical protein